MRFAKAHGLGNDFVLVAEEDAPGDLSPWAVRLCDRHRGIGGDGVVLHARTADGVSFRLVNADGLVGEISGNGLRCLAALALRKGWAPARHVVTTVVGPKAVEVEAVGPALYRIVTDLGPPGLGSADVPVALEPPAATVIDYPLEFHPFFPRRTNVEFVTVVSPSEVRVRFWERGVGYTMASGTGSASAVVASILTGRTGRAVRAVCDGGTLDVEWPEGGSVKQTGEAEILYEGEWLVR